MEETLEAVAVGLVLLGWLPATLFPVFYSRSPWRSSPVGRALMTKTSSVAVLYNVSVGALFLADRWWYAWVQVASFAFVALGVWFQFLVMLSLQREGKREDALGEKGAKF